MSTPNLLTVETPLHDHLSVPYHDFGPTDRPPRLVLVAGLHGNELNGVFVLARLADFLSQVAHKPLQTLRERVVIVPAVNLIGVNLCRRVWPPEQRDINRHFPGHREGASLERLTAALVQLTKSAYYRVDIHSSNRDIEEMPQVRLYEPNDDERATACLFGLPAVIERPTYPLFTTTLLHAWQGLGGENFVIQGGQADGLQMNHCGTLFRALLGFLDRTGIVTGLTLAEEDDHLHYFSFRQAFAVLTQQAGWFVSHREVGQWLQAGDLVGCIYDGFNGMLCREIKAPVAGLLGSLRRQPLLFEGDLIARIFTAAETDIADLTLHSPHQ